MGGGGGGGGIDRWSYVIMGVGERKLWQGMTVKEEEGKGGGGVEESNQLGASGRDPNGRSGERPPQPEAKSSLSVCLPLANALAVDAQWVCV